MFGKVISRVVTRRKFVGNQEARRQFREITTATGQLAAKKRGIQYFKLSIPEARSPGSPLPVGVPGMLVNSLPDSRQSVKKLAGDTQILTGMLQYFFGPDWSASKEGQASLLVANAPEKEAQHIYGLLTRLYGFSPEGWQKLVGLSDSQLMLLLASCVPNGIEVFPSMPLDRWGLGPLVSPIPMADLWSKDDVNAVIQLGIASYIQAKLYPRVQQGNLRLIPLFADTQDPYHIFSGSLLWCILLDLELKAARGLFLGAGQSPWRFLDITNNYMGAVYWDVNFEGWVGALEDQSLPLGKGKPIPDYQVLKKSLRKQYARTSSLWIRRGLTALDTVSWLGVLDPKEDLGWGGPMYDYTPSPEVLAQAQAVQDQLAQETTPLISGDQAKEIGQDLADKINKE